MFRLAIVGRPNVGKSALFNRIVKQRIAIVDEAEGITRDRLYARADYFGHPFEIIDTGGVDARSMDQFQEEIATQARLAMKEADTLVMVVDGTCPPTTQDYDLASTLLALGKPIVLAVNKIDHPNRMALLAPYYSLGIQKVVGVSALQGFQIAEVLDAAWEGFAFPTPGRQSNPIVITVIGRPNVGKSHLVNTLIGQHRCVVSPVAGTTRDSIEIPLRLDDQDYLLIDTAGIRKKNAEKEVVDKFAAIRTRDALERCHLCLLMLDATTGLSMQDKRIATQIEEAGKGCVVLLNKWDLVSGCRMEHTIRAIQTEAPFLAHCPFLCISAKSGRNCDQILRFAQTVYHQFTTRIPTHPLNSVVEKALQLYHPPMIQGRRLRIYYLTQVATAPPRFALFVNDSSLMTENYKKYLVREFRKAYSFLGVPLHFFLKNKKKTAKSTE